MDEHEIISEFVKVLGQPRHPYSRIGDDASFISIGGRYLVWKSDMLVASTDVPKGMTLSQAARKSIVMSVSDLVVKGAEPKAALISLGLPRALTGAEVRELAYGFVRAREEFKIEILGGDTNEAKDMVIDCSMMGFTDHFVSRDGAQARDAVVVSGVFGYTGAGMRIIEGHCKADEGFASRALKAVYEPKVRVETCLDLTRRGLLSASIDSSDGLALSLFQLAEASRKTMVLDSLPFDQQVLDFARENKMDARHLALYGGEEYELIGTIPSERLGEAERVARRSGCSIVKIGRVARGKPAVVAGDALKGMKIERRGWVHFA